MKNSSLPKNQTRQYLQKSSSALKADVYLVEDNNGTLIVKDYSNSSAWIRVTICKILLNRELNALKKLEGLEGVPQLKSKLSKYVFAMEHIPGGPPIDSDWVASPNLSDQLNQRVAQMHLRGVTHNDIRPDNMILGNQGILYLIDYAGCFFEPKSKKTLWILNHVLFNFLKKTDLSKSARLKQRYRPEDLSPAEQILINETSFARKTTQWWKKWILPLFSSLKR